MLGLVAQRVISLTNFLVEDSLSLKVLAKSVVVIFFVEKLKRTLALQKFLVFLGKHFGSVCAYNI